MVQIQKGLEGNREAVPSGSALLQTKDYERILRKGSVACANCRNIKNSARDMTKKRRNWNNTGKNARIRHLTCFQNGFTACGIR